MLFRIISVPGPSIAFCKELEDGGLKGKERNMLYLHSDCFG
jgi:hypothetical protein